MRPTVGVVPAIVCLLLAGALGAWGWQDRDETRARARAERAARDDPEELFEIDGDGGVDLQWLDACSQLFLVAGLAPPSSRPPVAGGTTLAVSSDDLARELIGIIDARPEAGVPALESSRVQDAIAGVRGELLAAIDRSDDPLAEPGVAAAAADLDGALIAVC